MARTTLTPQKFTAAGLAVSTVTPSADGVVFRNNGKSILMVTNGSGGSINVTPIIAKQVEGVSVTSPARAIAAGATRYYGPFGDAYNLLDSTGQMNVDFSAITSVTVALLTLP